MAEPSEVERILAENYGQGVDTLGGNVAPRVPRYTPGPPQLGQHNFLHSMLAAPGQPTADALERGLQGLETPQGVALSFLENGPVGPLGMARIPNPIRGYHGGPRAFDPEPGFPLGRFRDENLGTGEGAHAYGYGHYIAGAEGTARYYRDRVMGTNGVAPWFSPDAGFVGTEPMGNSATHWAALHRYAYANEHPVNVAQRSWFEPPNTGLDRFFGVLDRVLKPSQARAINEGRALSESGANIPEFNWGSRIRNDPSMYEVNLHAPEGTWLDWNRPVSGQSAPVRDALEQAGHRGRQIPVPETPEAATALAEAGIPGIVYDAGRIHGWTGPQSRNRVVFPGQSDIIEILRRYGIAAPVTAASVLSQYGGDGSPQQ